MSRQLVKFCDYCEKCVENKENTFQISRENPTHMNWSDGLEKYFCEWACLMSWVINNHKGF